MDAAVRDSISESQLLRIEQLLGKGKSDEVRKGLGQVREGPNGSMSEKYEDAILDAIMTNDRELAQRLSDACRDHPQVDPQCITVLHGAEKILGDEGTSAIKNILRDPRGFDLLEDTYTPPDHNVRIGVPTPRDIEEAKVSRKRIIGSTEWQQDINQKRAKQDQLEDAALNRILADRDE